MPPTGILMYDSLKVVPTGARLLGLECFSAVNLWTPPGNRGVFGGQIIAQALMSAIQTVQGMDLHSTHCYFLLPCDSRKPVTYAVERLRDGKSYSTRLVHAIQDSETIFTLTCSFSLPPRPNSGTKRFQRDFPEDIQPFLEAYDNRWNDHITVMSDFGVKIADTEENRQKFFSSKERPLTAFGGREQAGKYFSQRAVWLQPHMGGTRPLSENEIRAMIGYVTDTQAIATAGRTIGLSADSDPKLGMVATIDHTIHYYPFPDNYDGTQPLLHVLEAHIVDLKVGRGYITGRVYTEDGVLIATTSQEGVVRAQAPGLKPRRERREAKL